MAIDNKLFQSETSELIDNSEVDAKEAMNEANEENFEDKQSENETSNALPPKEIIISTQEQLNRDATVLRTVHSNLRKVSEEFVEQAKRDGVSEGAKELLNLVQIHLDAIKPTE